MLKRVEKIIVEFSCLKSGLKFQICVKNDAEIGFF